MTYLLDTHYMLWALADTKRLSKRVREELTNPDNQIVVSAVSFWEVALKSGLGKLEISGFQVEDLPNACTKVGFEVLPLNAEDSSTYHHLSASYHKDPFDRILVWQAIRNRYTLISVDSNVKKYVSEGLKVFG